MEQVEKRYLEHLVKRNISRRDFLRYSSIALTASAIPKVIGCSAYQPRQDCQRQITEGQQRAHKEIFKSALLGNIRLKNRIIRSATTQGLGDKQGRPTERALTVRRWCNHHGACGSSKKRRCRYAKWVNDRQRRIYR
jgi:hypothetical protein